MQIERITFQSGVRMFCKGSLAGAQSPWEAETCLMHARKRRHPVGLLRLFICMYLLAAAHHPSFCMQLFSILLYRSSNIRHVFGFPFIGSDKQKNHLYSWSSLVRHRNAAQHSLLCTEVTYLLLKLPGMSEATE